ncbi:MAG: hypothetical protein ABIK73_08460 [candidate division WOR-3 bacterium]
MLVLWRKSGSPIIIDDIVVTPYFDNQTYELEIVSETPVAIKEIVDNACLYRDIIRIFRGRAFVIDDCLFRVVDCNPKEVIFDISNTRDYVVFVEQFKRRGPRSGF